MPNNYSLSEADAEKIRSEERVRRDIRADLEALHPKDSRSPILEFLDTPFGMWILTALLGGLASWGWGIWKEGQVERERVDKIFVEISRRFAIGKSKWTYLKDLEEADPQSGLFYRRGVTEILLPLERAGGETYSSAYEEFKSTPLESLLLEIEATGSNHDRQKKNKIENAVNSLAEKLKNDKVKPDDVKDYFNAGLKAK